MSYKCMYLKVLSLKKFKLNISKQKLKNVQLIQEIYKYNIHSHSNLSNNKHSVTV